MHQSVMYERIFRPAHDVLFVLDTPHKGKSSGCRQLTCIMGVAPQLSF